MRFSGFWLGVSLFWVAACSSSGGGGAGVPCSAQKPCPGAMSCVNGLCAASDAGNTGGASSGGSGGSGAFGGSATGGGGGGATGGTSGSGGGGTGGFGGGTGGFGGGTGGFGGGTGGSGGTTSCNPDFCPSPAPPAVKCCVTPGGPCGGDFQQGGGCQNLGLGGSSP
jgi:hypothetical protein